VDPTANLKEQLDLAKEILEGKPLPGAAERLAELVIALHEWLKSGETFGFLPAQWRKK